MRKRPLKLPLLLLSWVLTEAEMVDEIARKVNKGSLFLKPYVLLCGVCLEMEGRWEKIASLYVTPVDHCQEGQF